jgi:hypothetical protein
MKTIAIFTAATCNLKVSYNDNLDVLEYLTFYNFFYVLFYSLSQYSFKFFMF